MVIGGVLCRSRYAHILSDRIAALQAETPFRESLQWKTLSKAKVDLFKRVVDEFLFLRSEQIVDFNCIIFERAKIDHHKHSENNPESGFFKFLFQHHLCHSRKSRYGPGATFRCYHGNMETGYDIAELKRCLNASAPNTGLTVHHPYRVVDFMPVKKTRCLQLSDILIGAVGYIINGKCETKPDSHRTEVASYLQAQCGLKRIAPTSWPDFGFNIWDFPLERGV